MMAEGWITPFFVGLRHDELLRRMMDWETPYKSPGERRAFYLAILRAAEANGYEKALGDIRERYAYTTERNTMIEDIFKGKYND